MPKKKDDRFLNNNENLPIKVDVDWTPDLVAELKRCKEDIFYFAENYFSIINLDSGRQKIQLYAAQRNAIQKIVDNRRTIICASRQVGKTTLVTVICLWYAIFTKDFTIAILANKEDQAKEILERIKLAYEELPNWLKAGIWEFTKEHIKLTNNSKIFVSTTSPDAIRGKSVNLLFIDEFAHVRKETADDFFKSIIPTISSSKKSKLVIVSTPKGAEGKYYEIYSAAEKKGEAGGDAKKGTKGWTPVRIHYSEVPGRDEEWKLEQLESINYDMNLWAQEFELEFLEAGTSSINGALIEKMKREAKQPRFTFNEGEYIIYEEPKEGHIYSFGVDAAQGVLQDWSITQILDITDLKDIRQAGMFMSNRDQPFVYAEKLNQIARQWGRPYLCIESNKEGAQVLDALIHTFQYDNIVTYTMDNDKRGYYQKPGIFCHINSKYTGITNMKYWVEHLEAVRIYDMDTIKEFETFVRKENKTWAAKKGFNDDRVMALIWGLIILEKEIAQRYLEVLELDDVGKPMRIADPDAELALQAMRNSNKEIAFTRDTGNPPPTMFARGYYSVMPEVVDDAGNIFGTGFRLII